MGHLTVPSPVGALMLTVHDGALVRVAWQASDPDGPAGDGGCPVLAAAAAQLDAYFSGRLKAFDLPLAPRGGNLQQRVWQAMSAIPYGSVASYGDIARQVDADPRAVGAACGANPIPIIIPCHRVVGTGHSGGYSGAGGLATKHRLLVLEGALLL
ncbi:MAG: methylated-DNA--[protein]-cysteine S-methyltransferase [Rhodospirillaceae bacterium]|nr:methylated-DNA--[protein]-cysteine S-methyltransferase [Rhodospirillaceae bacterium]